MEPIRIRLTHKMLWVLNGIDLTKREVGEVLVLPSHEAHVLIGLGLACLVSPIADPAQARQSASRLLTRL
jgi:hypothetical protein